MVSLPNYCQVLLFYLKTMINAYHETCICLKSQFCQFSSLEAHKIIMDNKLTKHKIQYLYVYVV